MTAPQPPSLFTGAPSFADPAVQKKLAEIEDEMAQADAARKQKYDIDPGAAPNPFVKYPDIPQTVSPATSAVAPSLGPITSESVEPYPVSSLVTFETTMPSGSKRSTDISWFTNGTLAKGPLKALVGVDDESAMTFEWSATHFNTPNEDGESVVTITVVASNGGGQAIESTGATVVT